MIQNQKGNYRRTQRFNPAYEVLENIEVLCGSVALFLISFFLSGQALFSLVLAFIVTATTLILHWLIFYQLTVIIDATEVRVRYGVGIIERRFSLSEIVDCWPVHNSMLGRRSMALWGVVIWPVERYLSWSDREIALPLRFRDAVRITMKNGETVRIATDEAERLSDFIHVLMSEPSEGYRRDFAS